MRAIYYSLLCDPIGRYERQWARSVASLRRHDPDTQIVLCLYGAATPETVNVARARRVQLVPMGSYSSAFGDIPPHWARALSSFPTLHKLLSLRAVCAGTSESLIFLDCDTYLRGDIRTLPMLYGDHDWCAREEPNSSRSAYGYDSGYLDESALSGLGIAEGLVPIPPYNTGVFQLSHSAATHLITLLEDFLWYAWRLLLGACLWRPDVVGDADLVRFVRSAAGASEHQLALAYPSSNMWILEEIATWLTLGRIPRLSHKTFEPGHVAQGSEYRTGDYLIAHYYSTGEDQFVTTLGE